MITLEDKIQPKIQPRFYCKFCDYGTSKKTNYDTHVISNKHKRITNDYIKGQNSAEIQPKFSHQHEDDLYVCLCGKQYKHRQGLWKHKQKCNQEKEKDEIKQESTKNEINFDKELFMMLINQNKELLEIVKNGTHNTNHSHNNTNSHNKAFNLNFFLNETCKNAMNITDFVDSIKLQLSDLMEVGELGYVEGISKIIVKNLNNLDETERPIHCTDKKRETMYIKDQGEWNKEDEKKTKLKKVVTKIADKNIRLLPAFREKYPEYKNSSSKTSDKYDKMVLEVMNTDDDKNEKIIHNISKVTTIKS
jgi:hypothetical protein